MTQPTRYERLNSYTGDNYTGADLDEDFNAVSESIGGICDNLALIQRDDGALANASVHPDSLNTATLAMIGNFNPRGLWVTATQYAVRDVVEVSGISYVAAVAHTAGASFAGDRTAGYWVVLGNAPASAAQGLPLVTNLSYGSDDLNSGGAVIYATHGQLTLVDPATGEVVTGNGTDDNQTLTLTTVGDRGRDVSASFATGDTVHVYAISDDTPTTASLVASAAEPWSDTGDLGGPVLPTGYTHWAYLGCLKAQSANSVRAQAVAADRHAYYPPVNVVSAGAATSLTLVSIGNHAPTGFCKAVRLRVKASIVTNGGGGAYSELEITNGSQAANRFYSIPVNVPGASGTAYEYVEVSLPVSYSLTPELRYRWTNETGGANIATRAATIDIVGYDMVSQF